MIEVWLMFPPEDGSRWARQPAVFVLHRKGSATGSRQHLASLTRQEAEQLVEQLTAALAERRND